MVNFALLALLISNIATVLALYMSMGINAIGIYLLGAFMGTLFREMSR